MSNKKIKAIYSHTIGVVAMEGRGFSNPVDLAISSENRIYVLSRTNPEQPEGIRIGICNMQSEYFGDFGEYGTGRGQFIWPTSLAIDEDDNVYLADEHNSRISIFDKTGKFIDCWGEFGSTNGLINGPSGICFDSTYNLLVVDQFNNRVQKFTKEGKYLDSWGSKGNMDDQFNLPWGISVTANGEILVADWGNNRVQKFSPAGDILESYGSFDNTEHCIKRPSSAVQDKEGFVYVADWGNEKVQIIDNEGNHFQELKGDSGLSQWAEEFFEANKDQAIARSKSNLEPKVDPEIQDPYEISARIEKYFWGPASIKLTNNGELLIVETNRHRIQVYSII